jgi:GH15 family glucan-1,4-alpha-glucosidase
VFLALLDRSKGQFRVGPYGTYVPLSRRYEPGTNIVETTWMTDKGWLVVRDALVIADWGDENDADHWKRPPADQAAQHVLVRTMNCIEGEVEVEVVCEPTFDFARADAKWTKVDGAPGVADATDGQTTLRLASDLRLGIEGSRVRARHRLREEDGVHFCALSWSPNLAVPADAEEAERMLAQTTEFWRRWLADGEFQDHPWTVYLQRSALALKGLTYAPTGALLAALTTSLPETPQGNRNWDYRFTWMRDSTFALRGLHIIGLESEAEDFMEFVSELECNEDGALQIMYGIDGRRDLTEKVLEDLEGYEHAQPVRIGNGAYDQKQNDVFGAVIDSIHEHTRRRSHMPENLLPVVKDQVECAIARWQDPDQGIWEARGAPKHYVSSKLMCWVALDRGAKLAEVYLSTDTAKEWRAKADEIKREICTKGVKDGIFRQHYAEGDPKRDDALDASVLLMSFYDFVEPHEPEYEYLKNTINAINRPVSEGGLTEHGMVLRYDPTKSDDGVSNAREGTFAICSFWLVSALASIDDKATQAKARGLCAKLLALASPLQLYDEEIEADTGAHLGNFPQAFTHLALIDAVKRIIDIDLAEEAERL